MAAATSEPVKKRRPQGPRVVKPRTLYLAVKGTIEGEIKVFEGANLEALVDLQTMEPGVYKVAKYTVQPNRKPAAAPTPTA